MSPVPDVNHEDIILSSASATTALNGISSSNELDQNPFDGQNMDIGSLAVDSMDNIDLCGDDDDDEPPTLTEEPIPHLTTSSAPSTPTGERDPPVISRRRTTTTTTTTIDALPQVEVRYTSGGSTNSDDNSGLFNTFFGCFKPIFSAMNKIGENIKYTKATTSTSSKTTDEWEIPIDHIMNDLALIGTGIEGAVFLGKLAGKNVACKRVKSKEETNIKHLKKLNHINVIKFRGISVDAPLFYIVMEYCEYGSLYDVLKRRRENNSCTKPTQVLDWSRQIANGVDYLHSNKILHRDLKSPNILIADKNILKISDFGTSKEISNRRSQIMSLNGTSAWMAPEVIRQEGCSEKIDVWSFGIVLWEILTCALPYHNIDPIAIMWGVGNSNLTLPIPTSAPEGLKLLMEMCWKKEPSHRPSFTEIIKHLDIAEGEIKIFEEEQEYVELTRVWSNEINEHLAKFSAMDISSTLQMTNDELMKTRQEELQHIADMRSHYQKRVQQVSTLYIELRSFQTQLEQREREIKKKERILNIQHRSSSSTNNNGKKRSLNPITEARRLSLKIMKAATSNLNDPKHLLSRRERHTNNASLNSQSPTNSHNVSNQLTNDLTSLSPSTATTNQDLSNPKSTQRRKKGPDHRRNNSKGSAKSWLPPSLLDIADQEKRRATISIIPNTIEAIYTINRPSDPSAEDIPIPSISANIDSKSNANNRELNPNDLKLDLQNAPVPSSSHQRPPTNFSNSPRKSSSSDPEEFDEAQYHNYPRQRRRRNFNQINNRINSPSSTTSRSIKSNITDPHPSQLTDEADDKSQSMLDEKTDDKGKNSRNVTFHLSPSIINERSPSNQQRKIFKPLNYTSSEEGEVEEIPSDDYILDDEKHRAKHEANGIFSSESEIYGERNNDLSSKNEGTFSDEGGHVSDDRPASRESLFNSEPEHEWPDQESIF